VAIDAGNVEYMRDPFGGHHMCFRPYYSDIEKYRPITDMIMASYVTTYRWLTWGSGESILSTRLPYSRPEDVATHVEIFKSDLIFDSDNICLEFSELAMTQRITTHDPERLARTRIKLDRILGVQMASKDFEQAVEAAIYGALEAGHVSSHIVADRMGMSWSSLRSKLNESGEGIRERIDRVRKRVFIEKYEEGLSFSQIAMSLAYNDQAAMNRAFRRWFGMTPSDWRRQNEQ
jgi:AraC-like DNA-binding protein